MKTDKEIKDFSKEHPCKKYFKKEDRICGETYNLAEDFGIKEDLFIMRIWNCENCIKTTQGYQKALTKDEDFEKQIAKKNLEINILSNENLELRIIEVNYKKWKEKYKAEYLKFLNNYMKELSSTEAIIQHEVSDYFPLDDLKIILREKMSELEGEEK